MGYFLQPTAARTREPDPAPVDNFDETAKNEVPQFFTVESGYRFYSPELGRWLSRDPIEEEGGWNTYCILSNAIQNRFDYLGLQDASATIDTDYRLFVGLGPARYDKAYAPMIEEWRKRFEQRLNEDKHKILDVEGKCGCVVEIVKNIGTERLRRAADTADDIIYFGHGMEHRSLIPYKPGKRKPDDPVYKLSAMLALSDGTKLLSEIFINDAKRSTSIRLYMCYNGLIEEKTIAKMKIYTPFGQKGAQGGWMIEPSMDEAIGLLGKKKCANIRIE